MIPLPHFFGLNESGVTIFFHQILLYVGIFVLCGSFFMTSMHALAYDHQNKKNIYEWLIVSGLGLILTITGLYIVFVIIIILLIAFIVGFIRTIQIVVLNK